LTDFDLNIIEGGWAHEERLFLDDFWDPLIIPEVIGTRRCKECKNVYTFHDYYFFKRDNCYSHTCKKCTVKRQYIERKSDPQKDKKYKEYNRQYRLMHKEESRPYFTALARKQRTGWSHEEYMRVQNTQDNCCLLCGKKVYNKEKRDVLHADHDHYSGILRGLLCDTCNRGIGYLHDNPESLFKGALYILFYKMYGLKNKSEDFQSVYKSITKYINIDNLKDMIKKRKRR